MWLSLSKLKTDLLILPKQKESIKKTKEVKKRPMALKKYKRLIAFARGSTTISVDITLWDAMVVKTGFISNVSDLVTKHTIS